MAETTRFLQAIQPVRCSALYCPGYDTHTFSVATSDDAGKIQGYLRYVEFSSLAAGTSATAPPVITPTPTPAQGQDQAVS
jgi:hypothetical protein